MMSDSYLLTVENIIVFPVLAYTEALMQTTVLVGLGEQPRRIHEILA